MNANEVLHAAHAAGVRVGVVGASLELDADRAPPDELLEEIRRFKPEILALLSNPAPEFSGVLKTHKADLMAALSEFTCRWMPLRKFTWSSTSRWGRAA